MKTQILIGLCAALLISGCSTAPTHQSNQMWSHLQNFQRIAQQNQNQRSVGSAGGQASAAYILNIAKATPFKAQMQPFKNRKGVVGQNIIVEITGRNPSQAIIIGAHYDSVEQGPGINDNASGTAVLLSLLEQYAQSKKQPEFTLYLAFWDSEEEGIAGSHHFVQQLTSKQVEAIQAYINVDMVGTRSPTALVLDADKSSVAQFKAQMKANGTAEADYLPLLQVFDSIKLHPKDAQLQDVLNAHFQQHHIAVREDLMTLLASDSAAFLGKVPVASIILFNEKMQGDVLEFAPCYHQACDDLTQIDATSLHIAREAIIKLITRLESGS